jgi:hypothetical protein
MREILVSKREFTPTDRHHTAPGELEGVMDSVIVRDRDTGKIVAIQYLLDDTELERRRLLQRWIRFSGVCIRGVRVSGMAHKVGSFGYMPVSPLRGQYAASPAVIYKNYPELATLLEIVGRDVWEKFQQVAPDQSREHHEAVAAKIRTDWWIGGVPYTSGVINDTAALPYHLDSGNITGAWSMMLCLRKNVGGGGLHLPEYDVTLGVPNGSVIFFDGQSIWHGVVPFIKTRKDAYRYTIVWYTRKNLGSATTPEEEILKAKRRTTRD